MQTGRGYCVWIRSLGFHLQTSKVLEYETSLPKQDGGRSPGLGQQLLREPGGLNPRKDGWGTGRPCPGLQGAMWSSSAVCFTEEEGQLPHEDGQDPGPCMVVGVEPSPEGVVLTGPSTPIQWWSPRTSPSPRTCGMPKTCSCSGYCGYKLPLLTI